MISGTAPDSDALPSGAHASHAVAPGDIAVGVVIGRTSEYFDYFVYGIASVLVFPFIFFPFVERLNDTGGSVTALARTAQRTADNAQAAASARGDDPPEPPAMPALRPGDAPVGGGAGG